MVPWWKRLVYGLVGWVLATCAVSLGALVWLLTQSPAKHSDAATHVLSGVFGFLLASLVTVFALSIFGWLLGIPYVLLVRNSQGSRFWIYLAVGTGIGPALVLSPFIYSLLRRSLDTEPTDYLYNACIAAVVSGLTALIYLLLLRQAQRLRQ